MASGNLSLLITEDVSWLKGCKFWLSFDDFLGMSLESKSSSCNPAIRELYGALVATDTDSNL